MNDDLTLDELQGLADLATACADALDEDDLSRSEWRNCRWARKAFDDIATDALWAIDQAEHEQEDGSIR